jgi:hypothetical protein
MTPSFTCPYSPCIHPLTRRIPHLGAIEVFESPAPSVYNGMTVSIHRQMTSAFYFRIAYTVAKAIDDGQDALVAGVPAVVQNSYNTAAEQGLSVTDQRHRLMLAWIADPKFLAKAFHDWKLAGVLTFGSGRPENVMVSGDPNQDGNGTNDRLPGAGRNSFIGPRLRDHRRALDPPPVFYRTREAGLDHRIVQSAESRQKRVLITQDGLESDTAYFVKISNLESITTRAISRFHEIPCKQPIPMLRARYNWV